MFHRRFNRQAPPEDVNNLATPDPSMPPGSPQDSLVGTTLDKYKILREIGRGNTGIVYRATDPDIGRPVAIKVANPARMSDPNSGKTYSEHFLNEAQIAGTLNHPNIVGIFDARSDGRLAYIVMEYVSGAKVVEDYCRVDNRLSIRDIVAIVYKCAIALDYAHKSGVIHRNLHPNNILLDKELDVKLHNFGIDTPSEQGAVVHSDSPLYMSPERLHGEPLSPQANLFSLGVVLYQMITGKQPFAADNISAIQHRIRTYDPPPIREHRAQTPAVLQMVVDRILTKDPRHRYKTGLDLAGDLSLVDDFIDPGQDETTDKERFNTARTMEFFHEFPDTELWELVGACAWRRVAHGHRIVLEDDVEQSFYVIISGSVLVYKDQDHVDLLQAGDCFGEIGLLPSQERSATIRAGGDVTIMKLHAPLLARISLNCQLHFYKHFLNTLIERLSKNSSKAEKDASAQAA